MLSYLWVSIGGAIGSAARFWISGVVAQRYGQTFPYGTLTVNVTGSFIIGLFAADRSRRAVPCQPFVSRILHDRSLWRLHDVLFIQSPNSLARSGRRIPARRGKRSRVFCFLSACRLARTLFSLDD
jgi:hypothetical protein